MTAPTFESFNDFIEDYVLPLKAAHPSWTRLDGRSSGGNPKVAAFIKYKGQLFRVHSDANIEALVAPYRYAQERGGDPVTIGTSKKGKPKLLPAAHPNDDAGFYIYLQPPA